MAQYPTNDPTLSYLLEAANNAATVLSAGIDDTTLTIPVSDTSAFPSEGVITIGSEIIHYTSKTASQFNADQRGYDGSSNVSHNQNDPVLRNIIAADHNRSVDEIIAIATDLRNSFEADLNDAVSPAVTAVDVKERLDQLVTQLKSLSGEADWKTAPATTLAVVDSVKAALDEGDTPASTASDIKDRLDQIVSQLKLIGGGANWYTAPTSSIASLKTQQDINVTDISNLEQNVRNILVNGGMEIWQRGISFSNPVSNDYTADKWQVSTTETMVYTVARDAAALSGNFSAKLDITGITTAGLLRLIQSIENPKYWRGKTISVSTKVYSLVAGPTIEISEAGPGAGTTSSTAHGGTGWETLTATRTLNSTTTGITIQVGWNTAASISAVYIDSVMLVEGSSPVNFVSETTEIQLMRCQRYYEESDMIDSQLALGYSTGTSYALGKATNFKVTKSAVPTVTTTLSFVAEEGSVADQKASYSSGTDSLNYGGFRIVISKSAAGNKPSQMRYTWTAEA